MRTSSYAGAIERLRRLASSTAPAPTPVVAYFGSGTAELSAAARAGLARMAAWLVSHDDARVLVEGHAAASGPRRAGRRTAA